MKPTKSQTNHPGSHLSEPAFVEKRKQYAHGEVERVYKMSNRGYYASCKGVYGTLNGCYVFMLDAVDIKIPPTSENMKWCGGTDEECRMKICVMYDLLNHIIVDSFNENYHFDPVAAALDLVKTSSVRNAIGQTVQYITVIDSVYESLALIAEMCETKQNFVIKILKGGFLEQTVCSLKKDDDDIKLNPSMYDDVLLYETGRVLKKCSNLEIRIVRIRDKGECTLFATNLSRDEFPMEVIEDLYKLRWGAKSEMPRLLARLQIKNFSGTSTLAVLQDICAMICISNEAENDAVLAAHARGVSASDCKHPVKLHSSHNMELLKDDLLYSLLLDDAEEGRREVNAIEDILAYGYRA